MRLDLDVRLRELLGETILRYKVVRLHFLYNHAQILNPISIFGIIIFAFVRLFGVGFCAANPPTPAANPTPDADIVRRLFLCQAGEF